MLTESCVMFFSPSRAVLSAVLRDEYLTSAVRTKEGDKAGSNQNKRTKDRCSDFNQQRPPLTEGGLPVVKSAVINGQYMMSLVGLVVYWIPKCER